jgi:hypothetical protein
VKPDATENIEESNRHDTDLSIAVIEGTREPSDDDAVQRAANGGYEVPLTLEEVNEPVYTELNEATVSGNPGDATRSFGSCGEPIYFELDDPRCLREPATNDANKIQESAYVEMSPILYTNVTSSFANLEPSVDAGIVQSDESRQYSNLPSCQLYADVAVCTSEQNPKYSNIHQGMGQVEH